MKLRTHNDEEVEIPDEHLSPFDELTHLELEDGDAIVLQVDNEYVLSQDRAIDLYQQFDQAGIPPEKVLILEGTHIAGSVTPPTEAPP